MNGATWALLSAYASFLSQLGQRPESQQLALTLHPLEPSGRDLSEAMTSLEDRGLMAGHWLTLKGVELAEGLAKAANL
jgi:hypothetical protein